jgi:pimeloyl-ACP methyl ester carboxylesterase
VIVRRTLAAAAGIAVPLASYGLLVRRGVDRLLDAPRRAAGEGALGPALDALGGEVVALRSRDGLRLSGRWLPAEPGPDWPGDPREAILLLHGWSGSIAPDLVEYGPSLRRTAGVLGLDFRGHGGSDDGPTTFGLREVDDVGGALAWLGERGIRRVALVGTSMGGVVALASIVVLGDGSLAGADADPVAPTAPRPAPKPLVVAVVAESVPAELPTAVARRLDGRLPGAVRSLVARRIFTAAAARLGGDPRATEPGRVIGLVAPVRLLLVSDEDDTTVPVEHGRRLAAQAGPAAEHWVVPGAGHGRARATDPAGWDARIGSFLRRSFEAARDVPDDPGILAAARNASMNRGEPDAGDPDRGG